MDTGNAPQSLNSFEVIVRQRVPYVTSFLMYLLIILSVVLIIIYFFFLPSSHSSDDMTTAYFILAMPDFIKNAFFFSIGGFLITLPLFLSARRYKDAALTFMHNEILIEGKKINVRLPVRKIRRVYCMEPRDHEGQTTGKFFIYFEIMKKGVTRVRLKQYEQAEAFIEKLNQFERIKVLAYDFHVNPDPLNEV